MHPDLVHIPNLSDTPVEVAEGYIVVLRTPSEAPFNQLTRPGPL